MPCPGSGTGLIFLNSGTWYEAQTPRTQHTWDNQGRSGGIQPYLLDGSSCSPHSVYISGEQAAISRLAVQVGTFHVSPWTPHPWLLEIPRLIVPSSHQQTLLLSLQALSNAFQSLESHNEELRITAFHDYMKALKAHRIQILRFASNEEAHTKEFILQLLLTAMALLEFEMMAPSSMHSWFGHVYGCMHLLNLVGPEVCQASPFLEIFRHLRFVMAYVTLTTGRRSYLSLPTWRKIPFTKRGKTSLDQLIDSILTSLNVPLDLSTDIPIEQEIRIASPHNELFQKSDENSDVAFESIFLILSNVRRLCSLSQPQLPEGTRPSIANAITFHAERLLLQPYTSFGVALQAVFAIKLVAQFAPFATQREIAEGLFTFWHGRLTFGTRKTPNKTA